MRILIGHFREKKIRAFISFFNEDEVQNSQVHKTCDVFKELTEIRLFITFSGTLNRVRGSLIQQSRKWAWNKQSLVSILKEKKKNKSSLETQPTAKEEKDHLQFWQSAMNRGMERAQGSDKESWWYKFTATDAWPFYASDLIPLQSIAASSPRCNTVLFHLYHMLLSKPHYKNFKNRLNATAGLGEEPLPPPEEKFKSFAYIWVRVKTIDTSIPPCQWMTILPRADQSTRILLAFL